MLSVYPERLVGIWIPGLVLLVYWIHGLLLLVLDIYKWEPLYKVSSPGILDTRSPSPSPRYHYLDIYKWEPLYKVSSPGILDTRSPSPSPRYMQVGTSI